MSAGKGDDRRPSQVSEDELARRWEATFGELKQRASEAMKQHRVVTDEFDAFVIAVDAPNCATPRD